MNTRTNSQIVKSVLNNDCMYTMSPMEKVLFLTMLANSTKNVDGLLQCRITFEKIKTLTTVSTDKAVKKYLNGLISKGYLLRDDISNWDGSLYTIQTNRIY